MPTSNEPLISTTTTTAARATTAAGGCSNVNLMFSTSTNSYPDGRLACYDDKGFEMVDVTMEDTMVNPGTTCIFLSSGHVDEGGFAVEMLSNWKVTLTELYPVSGAFKYAILYFVS